MQLSALSAPEWRAYHRQVSLVRTMFIHTADQNYVGARAAFFEHRDYDFWWLTLHAVEKYLKAALLLNGATANEANHNVETLLKRLQRVDPRLTPPDFVRPKLAGPPGMFEERTPFLTRLNGYGDPSNRYAAYSYVVSGIDIFQADHLVYWARRHARVLKTQLFGGETLDWVQELAESPREWRHNDGSPLETLADAPGSKAASSFVRGNIPFFPKRRHQPLPHRGTLVRNGPWFNLLTALKDSAPGSDERAEIRATLTWAKTHIYLARGDRRVLESALEEYP